MKRWVLVSVGVIAVVLGILIWLGYQAEISGFMASGDPKTQTYRPAKTIWDWLQLLIVPLVLAVAALWFNYRQVKTERVLAKDQQRENALQAYLKDMADLMLEKNLRTSQGGDEVRQIARVRTLAILRMLDGQRNGIVLKFLQEAGLRELEYPLGNPPPVDVQPEAAQPIDKSIVDLRNSKLNIDLQGANLIEINLVELDLSEANLSRARLSGAKFNSAILEKTNFSHARLDGADFYRVELMEANLSHANLIWAKFHAPLMQHANLRKANLSKAKFRAANLYQADLRGANLTVAQFPETDLKTTKLCRANLTGANLSEGSISKRQEKIVKSLKDAAMPDGTTHD